jgi:hypothetical protein
VHARLILFPFKLCCPLLVPVLAHHAQPNTVPGESSEEKNMVLDFVVT